MLDNPLLRRAYHVLIGISWALFLVTLPVTSFPYLPSAMGGGALVRPLFLYPLLVLTLLYTLPRLFTGPLPATLRALLPFVLLALASSMLSFTYGIAPLYSVSVGDRVLRALITLAVGGAVYLAVTLKPGSLQELRGALLGIYTGMGIALFWGSLQALYVIHFIPAWFDTMSRLQRYVSIRRLFTNRISGMTYEPNWFGEQIVFLLLPWLLASALNGYTVFRWRRGWFTVEIALLVWAAALLPFTFSRAGVMTLIVLLMVSAALFVFRGSRSRASARLWIRRAAAVLAALVVMAVVIFFAGTRNEFFSRLWSYWIDRPAASLSGYFVYLGFDARLLYSQTAYSVYAAHPVLGVGLGNYAFYFLEHLPERPLAQVPEVLNIITPDEGSSLLITPKNFYLRLLAETGIVGTAAFAAFVVAILGCALYLLLSGDRDGRFWGMGGLLGLTAFLLASLSFDSFAFPNMWVVFGLVTAAAWRMRACSCRSEIDNYRNEKPAEMQAARRETE